MIMGAWGVTTLQNDLALDIFDYTIKNIFKEHTKDYLVKTIVDLLDSEYEDEQLVGIKLIEVAVSKKDNIDDFVPIDNYKKAYDYVMEELCNVDMTRFIDSALSSLKDVKNYDNRVGWINKKERDDYIEEIERNLLIAKKKNKENFL